MRKPEGRGPDRGRLAVATLFAAGVGAANLAWDAGVAVHGAAAALGLLLAAGMVRLWGDRTRPAANGTTLVAGMVLAVVFGTAFMGTPGPLAALVRGGTLGAAAGCFLFHDHRLGPTALVALAVLAALAQPHVAWSEDEGAHAAFIGTATTLGLVAALLERERLQALEGFHVSGALLAARVAFVATVTAAVLAFREQIQVARAMAAVGIDPGHVAGRWFLLGLIVLSMAVAALLFRGHRKPGDGASPGP